MDSPHCKTFVDNIQTAFNTKMPPKSMLLHGEVGRSGGDLSAGKMFGKCGYRGVGSLTDCGEEFVTGWSHVNQPLSSRHCFSSFWVFFMSWGCLRAGCERSLEKGPVRVGVRKQLLVASWCC